jgi:hypothetical protein
MKTILFYLKAFFNPVSKCYQLTINREATIAKMKTIPTPFEITLNADSLRGLFITDDRFELTLNSFGSNKGIFSSTLVGIISESKSEGIQIDIKIKPNISFHLSFIIVIIAGSVYLYQYFINPDPISKLYIALALLIAAPFFIVSFSVISNTGVFERFEKVMKPTKLTLQENNNTV